MVTQDKKSLVARIINRFHAGRMAEISNLRRHIKSLESDNDKLRQDIIQLDSRNKTISRERDKLAEDKAELTIKAKELEPYRTWVPPGHFYSPIPDKKQIKNREKEIFNTIPASLPEIELNTEKQLKLLEELSVYYKKIPFKDNKFGDLRYFYKNLNYSYSDAIFLYSMIRHLKPARIIEIGTGYSSALILDVNEIFLDNSIQCTFIDPNNDLFFSLINKEDRSRIKVINAPLYKVDRDCFSELGQDDILLVDSTHVSKTGSDLNQILFDIMPVLKEGVFIHFHDIFYPLEYPCEWIYEGRAWNEAYLLRAFLMNNRDWEIMLFTSYLQIFYREWFESNMPLCLKQTGGQIWLNKIGSD